MIPKGDVMNKIPIKTFCTITITTKGSHKKNIEPDSVFVCATLLTVKSRAQFSRQISIKDDTSVTSIGDRRAYQPMTAQNHCISCSKAVLWQTNWWRKTGDAWIWGYGCPNRTKTITLIIINQRAVGYLSFVYVSQQQPRSAWLQDQLLSHLRQPAMPSRTLLGPVFPPQINLSLI